MVRLGLWAEATRRREFTKLLGGVVLPLAANAQQADRFRRVGVPVGINDNAVEAAGVVLL